MSCIYTCIYIYISILKHILSALYVYDLIMLYKHYDMKSWFLWLNVWVMYNSICIHLYMF